MASCLKEGQPFGLLFVDCDDFKQVNDRFGHEVDSEAVGTTASIGMLWSDGGVPERPIEDILRRVDERLYAAKQTKNAISY